jgi:hypothetical protein
MNRTMTVKEVIQELSKIPDDKVLQLKTVVDPSTFQSELHIVFPTMEITV